MILKTVITQEMKQKHAKTIRYSHHFSHHPIRNIIKHAKKIGTNFGDPSQARILIISLN